MKTTTSLYSAKLVALVWMVWMQASAQLGMVEGKTAHVTITNHLEQRLRVICASRENNLGQHELDPITGSYNISFTPNIFGTTAFWCTFDCDAYGKRKIPVWLGWLRLGRTFSCTDCNWVVTPNGFQLNSENFYSWRP